MRIRFFFLLLTLSSIASANKYYVATPQNGGNDNYDGLSPVYTSGSHGPWASWNKAFTSTSVQPGDSVFFRGGVYQTTVKTGLGIRPTRNGTSNNWIVYINYPGEEPILDCGNIVAEDILYSGLRNDGVSIRGIEYIKLFGLTVRNVKQYYNRNYARGIYIEDGIVIIENCKTYNCWGHGMHSEFTEGANESSIHSIINCDSYNNCDSISGDPLGSNAGATGAGFDAWDGGGTNGKAYFYNCRAWGNSDQGWSIPTEAYVKCEGCWSFANKGYVKGNGAGFKMGWQDINLPNLRREMINCVATYNDAYGFFTNEKGSDPPYIAVKSNHFNNIAYHNGGFGFIIQDTEQADDIEQWRNYSNNISYLNTSGAVYNAAGAAKYSGSNNTWDIPLTLADADFASLDTTGITAPRQADGSLPDNSCYMNFLRLSERSRAINMGIKVGLEYSGSAPDLGAFEYISGTSTPPTPPVYSGSVIENATPSRLDMTFNLTLANIVPAASAFTVIVNSSQRAVNSVAVSGTRVSLTLANPVVYGDIVTVAYTKPATNPIQTSSGGQAASFSAYSVKNNVAAVSPELNSSAIENATPSRLDMTFSLTLANIVPAASAFTVIVNSSQRAVNSVAISGTRVSLTLSNPVVYGDIVTVAYAKAATNPIQTSAGGQAASFSAYNVKNNVAAINPAYISSVVENATPSRLDMTYSLSLANIVPAASAFSVIVNSVARSVSSVAISGTKVLLTIASPVVYGDLITVAYTKPATNPLQTTAGGQVTSMSAQSVVNNCTMPDNQPPVVSLSSPTKSSSYVAPATITIDATASDPDGSISKVEFYQGTVKIGERTSLPYSFTWKEVPEGNYSITAVATDNYNLKATSGVVSVVVEKSSNAINKVPVVTITSPNKGRKYKKNDIITIEAVATDPDGSITKVEFKSGSAILAELTSSPYVYTWNASEVGNSVITVIATDNLGATSSENLALFVGPLVDMNSDNINIYPNPNDGHFKIEIDPEISEENYSLKIVNLAGKIIYHKEMAGQESAGEFDLSSSPSGAYVVMITSDNNIRTTKKFIKR